MRHPNSGLSEDDLSRLTGSSLSPESSSSNGSSSSPSPSPSPSSTLSHNEQQQTTSNGALVATTTARNKDSPLLTATAASTTTLTPAPVTLDAELLKNLKNTSTHSHLHPPSNGNAIVNLNVNEKEHCTKHNHNNNHTAGSHFNSSYLPEFIDPLDWQKSRKRKERLDSASFATQDRKLIRSNSEELLTNEDDCHQQLQQQVVAKEESASTPATANVALKLRQHVEAIRRVASEDSADGEIPTDDPAVKGNSNDASTHLDEGDENDASAANRQQHEPLTNSETAQLSGITTKDMTRGSRLEMSSPSRSHRHSPNRSVAAKYHRDSDDSECEHERRRSSERFCKSRAPPGRKASGIVKKSGKMHGSSKMHGSTKMHGDENSYKYDISALKYERRGFVSMKLNGNERSNGADYNDNNLIDFHIIHNGSESSAVNSTKTPSTATVAVAESQNAVSPQSSRKSSNSCSVIASIATNNINATSAEALPWESSTAADQTEPMLSSRYATARHHLSDCIDTAAKLSKVMPYPQQFHKQAPSLLLDDDCLDPLDTYRAFTSLENLKTREMMQQVIPAMMSFQTPEERLKQLNKRLTALKKKLVQFEEAFEVKAGYRPSHAEKLNDKYMRNVLSELSKLRKEKQQLKSDPMAALGLKVSGGMDAAQKLEKMKATLNEIEQDLSEKRKDANRSEVLEDLTAAQLLHEKSAVQHVLLYFETLYGRPSSKEERDAARPLYDRYRQIKRLVSRSVTLSGSAATGVSELPTILEHEAMVFESTLHQQQYSANENTDNSNNSPNTTIASVEESSTESTTTTTASQPPCGEDNISLLGIDQLWEQLDKTREEKQLLKNTIRDYETAFEEQNGRKMLKHDRKIIEETYAQYKDKKAKTRLLQALIKKQISR